MTAPITLEYTIGDLRDKSASRRQQTLLKAAPLIQSHYQKLSKRKLRGLEDVSPALRKETLDFYNAVVRDGRFVRLLKSDPQAVADKLKLKVRPDVIDVVTKVNVGIGGPVEGPVEAVIAVAVVIVLAPKIPAPGVVIDEILTLKNRL